MFTGPILTSFSILGSFALERKNFETAVLGKRAQFQCSVQSPNAAEVEIWWEFEGRNITQDDEHYEVRTIMEMKANLNINNLGHLLLLIPSNNDY